MATRDFKGLHEPRLLELARRDPDPERRKQAASELLERYQDRIYAWCHRMVGNHEQALDLAQESLITAYRDLGSFRGEARFATWIFMVTRRRCLSALRKPALLVDEEDDPDKHADVSGLPDRLLEDKLDEEQLLRIIRTTLAPLERDALWLRCMERMPLGEITRLLGIAEASGARGVLQRARRRLRVALAGAGDGHEKGSK